MKGWKLVVLPLAIIIVCVFVANTIAQQKQPSLLVHPSNIELTINPGEVVEKDIVYQNNTNGPVTIYADARNFTAEGQEGGVLVTKENTPFSLAQWISISPTSATVPANGAATFHVKVSPPKNAEAGGHFGAVVFGTKPKGVKSSGAAISQEISSLILAKIPGDVVEQANVVSITTTKPFYEFGPVTFEVEVKNTGKVHIQPFGSIQVTDMLGNKYDAPLELRNVLPGATRKIPAVLNRHLLVGKYNAVLIASYGTKNVPLYGSADFWAFPVRYASVVIGIILLLFLLRRRLGRSLKALITGK